GQRVGVGRLQGGAVVLRPVGDPAFAVVAGGLVHPALADVGDVAHDAGRGEAGKVAHDGVLEFLCLPHREPPVLAVGDHVAHVQVVRDDLRLVEQRERQVEERLGGVVDAGQQHATAAYLPAGGAGHGAR